VKRDDGQRVFATSKNSHVLVSSIWKVARRRELDAIGRSGTRSKIVTNWTRELKNRPSTSRPLHAQIL
jgi:hypothetical protein